MTVINDQMVQLSPVAFGTLHFTELVLKYTKLPIIYCKFASVVPSWPMEGLLLIGINSSSSKFKVASLPVQQYV